MGSLEDSPRKANYERRELENEKRRLWKTLRHKKRTMSKMKMVFKTDVDRQKRVIATLDSENQALRIDFNIIGQKKNLIYHDENREKLQDLAEEKKQCEAAIEKQRNLLEGFRKRIYEYEHALTNVAPIDYGPDPGLMTKKLQQGEIKLEKQSKIQGQIMKDVQRVRDDIDKVQRLRVVFLDELDNSRSTIALLREDTKIMGEQALMAYHLTEEYQTKIKYWKDANDKESIIFRVKREDLFCEIHFCESSTKFMKECFIDRSTEARQFRKERLLKTLQQKTQAQRNQVTDYEEKWFKISDITGSNNTDRAVRIFSNMDSRIYSLVKLCNFQKDEIEQMQNEILRLNEDIARVKEDQAHKVNLQQNNLNSCDEHLFKTRFQADQADDVVLRVSKVMAEVMVWLKEYMGKVDVKTEMMENPFYRDDGYEGIRTLNIMEYMKLMETSIQRYLDMHDFWDYKRLKPTAKIRLMLQMKEVKGTKTINDATIERRDKHDAKFHLFNFPGMQRNLEAYDDAKIVDHEQLRRDLYAVMDDEVEGVVKMKDSYLQARKTFTEIRTRSEAAQMAEIVNGAS